MGDETPPQPENFRLSPEDEIKALAELRDQLADYLATVERNTVAVKEWLAANKKKIIAFHQHLERAVRDGKETQAVSLIAQMGDAAGFVLSLQDFKAKGETAFGRDSNFLKVIAPLTDILPASLQEPLPELSETGRKALPRALQENQPLQPEEREKWWGAVTNWFNKEQKMREKQERDFRRQLYAVKSEILGLQEEHPYYIDSFMDWIAATLVPDAVNDNGQAQDAGAKMLQYQDPAYVIGAALADYKEAAENGVKAVRDAALEYSRLANAIDRQDVHSAYIFLNSAYPFKPTADSPLFRQILLEDYHVASLAELILTHIKTRADQYEMLRLSVNAVFKEPIAFTGAKSPQAIFGKFLWLVLDENDPLNPAALLHILAILKAQKGAGIQDLAFSDTPGYPNVFQRVAERFRNDIPLQKAALSALLTDINGKTPGAADSYVDLYEGLRRKDEDAVKDALAQIGQQRSAQEVVSLWHLCHPGVSLLEAIRGVSSDPGVNGALLGRSISAGLLGEIKVDADFPYGYGWPSSAAHKFEKIMEEDVLPALDAFSVHTARLIIAHTFSTGGLEGLRSLLSGAGGWLAKVAAGKISDEKKAEWVAALLEPFPSDIVKANILAEAAKWNPGKTGEILSALENNLVGENIRLTEDSILCNLPRIANIWYNSDKKTLRYTVQGQPHTLLEGIAPDMAGEILALIQRRGGFLQEKDGLFKPENIDAIHHSGNGATLSWHRAWVDLNADAQTLEELKGHPGFLHVTDRQTGNVSSYNSASICLLQKLEDGAYLMIDKYGASHVLDGHFSALMPQAGSAYFNPENASIVRLNPKKNSFEFRVESADFEKLMGLGADQFFYTVQLKDAAELADLKQRMDAGRDIHAPNQKTLPGLHFNMKALGYLAYDEEKFGFYCRRYGPTNKPGFIQVEPDRVEGIQVKPAMVEEIMTGIGGKTNVIRVGNLLVHQDSVDDAYYNVHKEKLQFVIGREIQEIRVGAPAGLAVLAQLAQDKQFTAISEKSPAGGGEVVTDAVRTGRATLLVHNPEQGRTHIITENLPFHVNLGGEKAQALFHSLEEQGRAAAKASSSAKSKVWTQSLSAALDGLPKLAVTVCPVVDTETPAALLRQALGQAKAGNGTSAKKLKISFATAASLPGVYERFTYPEGKKAEQPRKPDVSRKKPGLQP